jgi:Family of unknown function (DUF6152)
MKPLLPAIFVLLGVAPAWAHHATAVTFDIANPRTITGTITRIQFQNPHVLVLLDSISGAPQNWTVEFPSVSAMFTDGVDYRTLHLRDSISVIGFPARSGSLLLSAREATLPGGIHLALSPEQLEGHHSYAARYDTTNKRTLTGTVTRLDWSNPRASMDLEVRPTDNSVPEVWTIELGPVHTLTRSGWNKDAVKVQDKLTVVGAVGRVSPHTMFVAEATLPNGVKLIKP